MTTLRTSGPVGGTAVDHRVCVVSRDWLAADRVGVELMGIDFSKIGILGPPLDRHIRHYKLASNIEKQLIWKTPPETA